MASMLPAGISIALAGVLSAAITVSIAPAEVVQPEPASTPVAAFQPREPARAPTEPPLRAARPAPAFALTGSGEGHGVGLSQWGAYSLARQAHNHEQIVRHYYTGVEIGAHPAASAGPIRVNLFHGKGVGDPQVVRLQAVAGGPVAVALAPGAPAHAMPAGTQWTVEHDGGFVLRDGNGEEIERGPGPVQVTYPGGGLPSLRLPQLAGSAATGEGALNRGHLEITAGGGALHPVVVLNMEDYLLGVDEMPAGWPVEALKAQALAARTFAADRMAAGPRPECACHVNATIADQVYVAYGKEGAPGATGWLTAVRATTGQVITYKGGLIEAVYSAAHARRSEHVEDSWAFGDSTSQPYLRSVADPWAQDTHVTAEYRRAAWRHEVDHATLADLVGLATIARVEVAQRTAGGSPLELAVSGWDENGARVEDLPYRGGDVGVAAADLFLLLRQNDRQPPSQQIDQIAFTAYPDVPSSSPHAYNIAALTEQGIVEGRPDGSFAPGDPVRRDEMATSLARALELAPVEEDRFTDVPADSVHRQAINAVAAAGIIEGFGDGRFGPGTTVTRGQMATFLARGFGMQPAGKKDQFADIAGSVHRQGINAVAEHGVIAVDQDGVIAVDQDGVIAVDQDGVIAVDQDGGGAGCEPAHFCPGDPVTRGQMASFLARAIGYGW